MLSRRPNEERHEANEEKWTLAKYKVRIVQLDTHRIQKLHYVEKLDFLP